MLKVSGLVTQFGDYYIDEGQNESRLLTQLRQKTTTTRHAKSIIYDGELYRFANVALGEVVQQFQKQFTPKGVLNFKPNEIRLRNIKVDLELHPDDLKGTWAGFLIDKDTNDRGKWPIVRYAGEKQVIPQIHNDMELKAYYKGKYKEPVVGTPGTTSDVLDGVGTLLDAGIADGSMQVVSLSEAVSKANAFDMIEEFVENFDAALEGTQMQLFCDPKVLRWYHQDKRNTHGADVNYDPKNPTVDFSTCKLIGLPSMAGVKAFWSTAEGNFLSIRRKNGMNKPVLQDFDRSVKFMTDWWEGLGFGYNELVYVAKWA